MRSLLRSLAGIAIALAALALLAEGVLQLLPVTGGIYRDDPPDAHSSARLLPGDYVFSLGWDLRHVARGRINAQGFPSPHDYSPDTPAIGLYGDSFAEALMVPFEQSTAGRIEQALGDGTPVYDFGLSGAALPHYLGMLRETSGRYRITAAVLLVIPGDYVEGFFGEEGAYGWGKGDALIELDPAAVRDRTEKLLRHSALLRYLRSNLHFNPAGLLRHPTAAHGCAQGTLGDTDRRRIERFLDELPAAAKLPPPSIVLVFDADRAAIYDRVDRPGRREPPACQTLDAQALALLEASARQRGFGVVDGRALFEARYAQTRRMLDFTPFDRHWNADATQVVGEAVAQRLRGN